MTNAIVVNCRGGRQSVINPTACYLQPLVVIFVPGIPLSNQIGGGNSILYSIEHELEMRWWSMIK